MRKRPSARQKMINLMYLVFIAMLALNVSTEVLEGFDLINENLKKTIENSVKRNSLLYQELATSYDFNPEKVKQYYDKAQIVKAKTDSLYNYMESLKIEIARNTDGPEADVNNIDNRENVDASSIVMLSPLDGKGEGYKLEVAIDVYREEIVQMISEEDKQALVNNSLSTEPSKKAKKDNKNWVVASFDRMPTIAVLSFMTGLQASVKQAEGEALANLLKDVDLKDIRVNELNACVVPESNYVMAGTNYSAHIFMTAQDTTQRPRIVVNGKELPADANGVFSFPTSHPMTSTFKGYIELTSKMGTPVKRFFEQSYTVMEPSATVAPLLMDVVYAGIDNPISISVPGVPAKDVRAVAIGGTLTPKGNNWVARPGKVGGTFVVNVLAKTAGRERQIASKTFRIRKLPDPVAYIDYVDAKGASKQFKNGSIARASLLNAPGIKAAIDDGILDIPFRVVRFRTVFVDVMGNAIPEVSDGANFSARQLDQMRRLSRGKFFFIAGIKVIGPDGIERDISPIEVRIN